MGYHEMAKQLLAHVPDAAERVPCPAHELGVGRNVCSREPLWQTVIHLNDQCGWSREQIADWLDSLDLDLTVQPKPVRDREARQPAVGAGFPGFATEGVEKIKAFVQSSSFITDVTVHADPIMAPPEMVKHGICVPHPTLGFEYTADIECVNGLELTGVPIADAQGLLDLLERTEASSFNAPPSPSEGLMAQWAPTVDSIMKNMELMGEQVNVAISQMKAAQLKAALAKAHVEMKGAPKPEPKEES